MEENCLFTEEEINKLNLTKFISELFNQYKELYLVSVALYNCSLVEKGKTVGMKTQLKLSTTFKYDSCYCFWFNGGAQAYQDENQLKKHLWQFSVQNYLSNYSPVKFYLKENEKKITYDDFESYVLNKSEFNEEKYSSIFAQRNKIIFCKDTIKKDIDFFLGNELIAKQKAYQNASSLFKELSCNNGKKTYVKI